MLILVKVKTNSHCLKDHPLNKSLKLLQAKETTQRYDMWDWLCSQFSLLERWIAHRISNMEASKLKRKVFHLSFRRQGNIWAQNYSLILGCLHASCFFYIMLKWTVGMAFGGSEQISFYWLLNWPSRGTNRREAEQWRKKKGRLKILKDWTSHWWWME